MDILSTPNQYLYELRTTSPAEAKRLWRKKIKEKWDYECAYCGSDTDLTMDHVVPRSAGGHSHWENIVTSCMTCNVEKGSQDIRPKQMPYKPDYWELANKRSQFPLKIPHHSWKTYLKWDDNLIKVA